MTDVVELGVGDIRACAYLVGALARERRLAGRPVPPEVDALQRRIEHSVTRSRQSAEAGRGELDPMEHVGTGWVAERLGWSRSTVLRHHAELDGRIVGNGWTFPRTTVEAIAELQGGEIDG